MAYVVAEVCCSANGDERYPVPTTITIKRIFANGREAAEEFNQDTKYEPEIECAGQDIYYLLWKLDEPLNIDRKINTTNTISNCGSWLGDESRMYGDVGDMEVELVPPVRIKERAKKRAHAKRMAQRAKGGSTKIDYTEEDNERSTSSRSRSGGNARYGGGKSGTPWNKFM